MDTHHEHDQSHCNSDHGEGQFIKEEKDQIHISAKDMSIAWSKDERFWKWTADHPQERCDSSETVAELIQVSGFQVQGSLDLEKHSLHHQKTYEVIYHIKFKVDAFGWHDLPVTFAVATPDGHRKIKTETLESYRRTHDWVEIHGGDFELAADHTKGKVEFGMYETESQKWKGGMVLSHVTIRPKFPAAGCCHH
ncbi:hypothetical protein Cni_G21032 [Canna indica]|uniref:Uncharacterized protein n=1 Tax=Canna indica TaxID=4628 RepID=A0AAQ3KU61_9LILI|nr:hypothetical protein Cni_G21032 [Canna indica]